MVPTTATEKPREVGEIERQLTFCNDAVTQVTRATHSLLERIEPVLVSTSPTSDEAPACSKETMDTALGATLQKITASLCETAEELKSAYNRCRL